MALANKEVKAQEAQSSEKTWPTFTYFQVVSFHVFIVTKSKVPKIFWTIISESVVSVVMPHLEASDGDPNVQVGDVGKGLAFYHSRVAYSCQLALAESTWDPNRLDFRSPGSHARMMKRSSLFLLLGQSSTCHPM